MFWSLSLQLMPGETMIADSTQQESSGLRPTYSVFLTNKRAAFRFDGFGSSMTQSFPYEEIVMAHAAKRMFITYLELKTRSKSYYLHIPEPDHWSSRILDTKAELAPAGQITAPPTGRAERTRRELHAMLAALRKHEILTDAELQEKSRRVDELRS